MLDLDQILDTAADPARLLNFAHSETPDGTTAVFHFDNADHTLPAPADGEVEEDVVIEADGSAAFVMYTAADDVLTIAITYRLNTYLG